MGKTVRIIFLIQFVLVLSNLKAQDTLRYPIPPTFDPTQTQQNSFDLGCARDAQNHHIRLRRQGLRRVAGACTCGQQGVQGLVARVFEDGEAVPVLEQVARDAVAHHADADHADCCHVCTFE